MWGDKGGIIKVLVKEGEGGTIMTTTIHVGDKAGVIKVLVKQGKGLQS